MPHWNSPGEMGKQGQQRELTHGVNGSLTIAKAPPDKAMGTRKNQDEARKEKEIQGKRLVRKIRG